MYATIKDPNIANGFSVLANILGGGANDPTNLIKADIARGQRDKLTAETEKTRYDLTRSQNEDAYRAMLSNHLTDPNWMNTPEGRAAAAGFLPFVPDGLAQGPGFLTGTSVFTRPDHLNPQDLSNVLIGTGVVDQWGHTPVGHKYETDVDAAADIAKGGRSSAGGGTPLDISPSDVGYLQELTKARALSKYPDAVSIDPATLAAIMPQITQAYQRTRDAELAVAQVLSGLPPMETFDHVTEEGWIWDDTEKRARLPKDYNPLVPGGTLSGTAPATAGTSPTAASGGAPTSGAAGTTVAPVQGQFVDGKVYVTKDGRKVLRQNGGWVPVP